MIRPYVRSLSFKQLRDVMGDDEAMIRGVNRTLTRYSSSNTHVPLSFVDDPPLVYPIRVHLYSLHSMEVGGLHIRRIHLLRLLMSPNTIGTGSEAPNLYFYLEHAVFVPYTSQILFKLERSDVEQVSSDEKFYETIDELPCKTWKKGFAESFHEVFWRAVYSWSESSIKSREKNIQALGIFQDTLLERKPFLVPSEDAPKG
mgnify:FL=1